VNFQYDFEMSTHEITVGEYAKVAGKAPSEVNLALGSKIPVTWVSYYDAIYFCNLLSEKEGFDPVYQFASRGTNLNGATVSLDGLYADYTKDGYRLPTEAEWEFAAKGTTVARFPWGDDTSSAMVEKNAWLASNALASLHPVGILSENPQGFFDLAGNAAEFVGGWYGPHPGDTLSDYAGLDQADNATQVIVKGGAYVNDVNSLRVTNRKDVYFVSVTNRSDYMGFRIARGAISNSKYSSQNGKQSSGTPIRIVASKSQIMEFFGTGRVKLSMVNGTNGKLATLNFFASVPQVREGVDSVEVNHPAISPDGQHIAFSTRAEGQSGNSTTYVTTWVMDSSLAQVPDSQATIPRWWVDPPNQDTFLVYASSGMSNGDSSRWAKERTIWYSYAAGIYDRVLSNQGSFHSGFSDDARFLATGYTDLRVMDRNTKTVKTLFRYPENGKDPQASAQACNVSVRPGPVADLLFLDFGYSGTSTIVKAPYGIHEYLFLADIQSGKNKGFVKSPSGFSAWDHSEWSNDSRFAVATVTDQTGSHRAIYAIKFPEGNLLKLAEGDDVLMPSLWVDPLAAKYATIGDSLGRYNEPSSLPLRLLQTKLQTYWMDPDRFDLLIFGTSREMGSLVPDRISGFRAFNFGFVGSFPAVEMRLIREYILGRAYLPKVIVLGLGPEFSSSYFQYDFDRVIAPSIGYQYDRSHSFWNSGMDSLVLQGMRTVLEENAVIDRYTSALDSLGHETSICWGWGGEKPALLLNDKWSNGQKDWIQTFQDIRVFAQELKDRNIQLILYLPPVSPAYRNTPYYSRYGGLRANVNEFLDSLKSLEKSNPNTHYWDFNLDGLHSFTDADARDFDHLCSVGAARLTDSISARLQALPPW
jgi:uncharacterized protein (TIGR02171 family)